MNAILFADNGRRKSRSLDRHRSGSSFCVIALVGGLVVLFVFFSFVQLWIQMSADRRRIGILDMVRMKLCKVDYSHDRPAEDRAGASGRQDFDARDGGALSVARQRSARGRSGHRRPQGRHGSALARRRRHRPCRPRHLRSRQTQRRSQGHRLPRSRPRAEARSTASARTAFSSRPAPG